jgi:very-short-patch-repair endonuclease
MEMTDRHELSVIDRTGRFLEFLAAVAREVQSRPIRDFRLHGDLLTPDDVPEHSQIRLGPRAQDPVWLRVPRLEEPERPPLPVELEGFVDYASLDDLDALPRLNPDLDLPSHNDLEALLEDWSAEEWMPWAVQAKPVREARRLYQKLLELRLNQQRQQATHEIVWGHALLGLDAGGGVVAPILITRAQVQLDEETGQLSVVPDGDPTVELDSLEGLGLPELTDLTELQVQVAKGLPIDPWDDETLEMFLRKLTSPLGLDAKVTESTSLPVGVRTPTVTKGWILLARPRPARHERFYDELADVLRDQGFLPQSLAAVVAEDDELRTALSENQRNQAQLWDGVAQRLLMPLATNEDQERIARQLAHARGVTVQGPPGTGKSHTIANLISHLIAHGKRVLVTAQNEQALQVLRDKIPAELRDLTVSILGSSPDAMDELRASIQAVLDIASQVDPEQERRVISEVGERIDRARVELRGYERDLVDALSEESSEFELLQGPSSAPDVAKWLASTSSHLGRIPDSLTSQQDCPFSVAEFADYLNLCQNLDPDDVREYAFIRPRAQDWPTALQLDDQANRLRDLQDLLADLEESGLELDRIMEVPPDDLRAVAEAARLSGDRLESLQERPWTNKLCAEIRSGAQTAKYWAELISQAEKELGECQSLKTSKAGHEVRIPDGDPRIQREFLSELRDRFSRNKGVPRLGKTDLRNFFSSCRVDELEPRTTSDIDLLRTELQLRTHQQALQRILRESSQQIECPIPDINIHFLSEASSIVQALQDAQDWETSSKSKLRSTLDEYFTKPINVDSVADIQKSHRILHQAAAQQEVSELLSEKEQLSGRLVAMAQGDNASIMWQQLLEAFESSDWTTWRETLQESERLTTLASSIEQWKFLHEKLSDVAPIWANEIAKSRAHTNVAGEATNLLEMWTWRQARTWIENLHRKVDVDSILKRAESLQTETARLVVDLARRSASIAVEANLDSEKQKALISWQQAIQKRGKGTGKNAARWMQVARESLPIAMGAIPAWIMPIHRVIENFDPRQTQLFDVVIIDESSQCDLLSAGVLALGHKCVVVGDDKQVSPSSVGVDSSRIHALQDSYLTGVRARQHLTTDESLYGLAARVFPSNILLKEHFRCVPEIINFSNRYYDNRILPLRETPDYDIGDPLQAVHVAEGVREGNSSSTAVNIPEAEALVAQVVQCHQDDRYDGLTFGVVTLLGNSQSKILEQMLIDALGFESFERRNLRIGNPPDFQGDERNVIFISVVSDDNGYQAVRTPDKQRVNVAASRAQDQLWVFYSLDPSTLHHEDQRRALIEYVLDGGQRYIPTPNQLELCESEFERDVLRDIVAHGFDVIPQYRVGSYRIDLVVEFDNGRIAVECDGDSFHGPEEFDRDIRRQRVLERLGWNFWRVRASEYYLDPAKAMARLWARIDRHRETQSWIRNHDRDDATVHRQEVTIGDDHESGLVIDFEPAESRSTPVASEEDSEANDELLPPFDQEDPLPELESDQEWTADGPDIDDSTEESASATWTDLFEQEADYSFGSDDAGLWIFPDYEEEITGTPMANRASDRQEAGQRTPCTFGYEHIGVDFGVVYWEAGSGEISCIDIHEGGQHLNRLRHGGRLGIYEHDDGTYFAEIRIMRLGSREYATAHNPEPGEFRELLGWSLNNLLLSDAGASSIGTREEELGDTGPRRGTRIVRWESPSIEIPALLYVTTRILPLMSLDENY